MSRVKSSIQLSLATTSTLLLATACAGTVVRPSETPGPNELQTQRSESVLALTTEVEEDVAGFSAGLGWHCFQNTAFKDGGDSGCGRSRPECKKLVAIYRDVYRDESIPFEPSECFPVQLVHGFTYRDSDTKWWYFRAFLAPARCESAFKGLPAHDLPLTTCHGMADPSLWPERRVPSTP